MRFTKLLTYFMLSFLVLSLQGWSQCSLITKNGSYQDPKSVCAPVDFTMNVWYVFMLPVDTSLVEIRFVWNDGTGATTTVPGVWNAAGDSIWAEASHTYLPTNECSRTVDAYLIFDGDICTSSGHQEQTFSTWGTDEENSGVLQIDPVVAYFCEGEDIVNVTFDDASTFNCNIGLEPDNPNRYFRWVQFIYNTYSEAGDRIPDVTIDDGAGNTYVMTDNSGIFVSNHYGPIERIPIPADGPNQTSYAISAPAGAVVGDIFEITMRNWNVCNPYDEMPTDGNPPGDLADGDNPPIITTAKIEIIAPPPVVVNNLFEFCTGDNIVLNASAGTADVNWYSDAALTNLLYTGTTFNPQTPPTNLDNSIAGSYSFWVTSYDGFCESAANLVNVEVYQTPLSVYAGADQTICADSVFLNATPPSVGSGIWTTTGGASIDNTSNFSTWVHNLDHGVNQFSWTVTNGICNTNDQVIITSDRTPDPAFAGIGDSICSSGSIPLAATAPNLGGTGHWLVIAGFGTLSDTASPTAHLVSPTSGHNALIWRVSSEFGACPISADTVNYYVDLFPGTANAGRDTSFCETDFYTQAANAPINSGIGTWSVLAGSGAIDDIYDPLTTMRNLLAGDNIYEWRLASQNGLCPTTLDTIIIHRDLSPGIANAGSDISLCLENSDTLDANSPAFGLGEWQVITNPSGFPPVFNPNENSPNAIITVLPGNEGEYDLQWTLENGICISRDTLQVDFGVPPPPGFAGHDSIICGLRTWLQSNTFAQGTGMWTQLSGPDVAIFTPDVLSANPEVIVPAIGTYTFKWQLTSGACAPSSDTVEITFLGAPLSPSISGDESCGPDSLVLTATSTDTDVLIEWFDLPTATVPIFTGSTLHTPYLILSRNYYVETVDTLTSCRSPRTLVEANIYPIPNPPLLWADTLCGAGLATIGGSLNPPATSIRWYANREATIQLGDSLSIHRTLPGNRYYWASAIDTLHSCESMIDSIEVIVHPPVNEPIALSDSSCGMSDLLLQGIPSDPDNDILWYDMPSGGSIVLIADSLERIGLLSPEYYWIAEYNDSTGCISNRVPVEALIHTSPAIPTVHDTSFCGPSSHTIRPQGDTNTTSFRWYDAPIGGTLLQESDTLNTGFLSSSFSVWVSGYNNETFCESPRAQVDISIFPIPSLLSIVGPTLVLKDQSGVIFSTTGSSTSSYTWTIPPGMTLDENMNDFIRLSFPNTGSYTISVYEINSHGCVGIPVSHPIMVISDSIAVDLGLYNQTGCTDVDFEIRPYLFGGTPPYTYSWTGDIGYLSTTSSLFTEFSPPGVGSYKLLLQVTDVNLKTAYDSIQINVFTSPTATITTQNQIVCVGDNLQLEVETSGYNAVNHLWSGPVHNLSSYFIQEPVYTPHQADTVIFKYELTDINGCKAYDSTEVYSDIPVAYFELTTEPGCSPLTVGLNNLSVSGDSYHWTFGDGSESILETPEHNYNNQTAEIKYYPINLEVTSILGCKDDITQYAMVWPNPVATLDAIPEFACSPAEITLFSTPGNLRYHWDYGDETTQVSSEFSTMHTFLASGEEDEEYRVRVITESSLNCIDTAFLDLDIYARPNTDFNITPPVDTFPNNAFFLSNLTEGTRWETSWDLGDNRRLVDAHPGTIHYSDPGNYSVTLTAKSEYCADSTSKTLYLYPAPPQAKFAGPEPGCQPHTVNFINASQYADSYLWEFGDGSISTSPNPEYTYYEAGIYRINLKVRGPGGESTYSDTARVHVLPHAFFDMAPRHVYVNDEAVHFFNLSEKADVFEWDFGDGEISTVLNPKHKYKSEGTYDITLKVWTDNECFDLYVMENAVFVEPSGVVSFPNVFRPDSPLEENRVFLPGVIDHVDEYHLMIFNRWGELLFESFDQEIGWDGIYRGTRSKQDVYVWKVTGTYSDGRGFSKSGDVTLLY